jgi:hypothetical protein
LKTSTAPSIGSSAAARGPVAAAGLPVDDEAGGAGAGLLVAGESASGETGSGPAAAKQANKNKVGIA